MIIMDFVYLIMGISREAVTTLPLSLVFRLFLLLSFLLVFIINRWAKMINIMVYVDNNCDRTSMANY